MVVKNQQPPRVVVLAGPNGSGKSTAAPRLLRDAFAVGEFVNADVIAQGLSAFNPAGSAMAAGRIMLNRLKELADERKTFAFETTLASRSFVPWLKGLIAGGYEFRLVFLWLPSADAAVARVAERVRSGGHEVPEATIRRRYNAGLRNFFSFYQPLASQWQMIDNSRRRSRLIAAGRGHSAEVVPNPKLWARVKETLNHETRKFN
jgi:predicted ABC-type ATPase